MAEQFETMLSEEQSALLKKYRHLLDHGFRGVFVHGLDTKGRVIVPASFRQSLGEKFVICLAPGHKAIALYAKLEWELRFVRLLELVAKDARMQRVFDQFSKYTYEDCECDAQGRVLLPQKLRSRFLADAKEVEISGAGTHIRIVRNEDAQSEEELLDAEIPDLLAFEAEVANR